MRRMFPFSISSSFRLSPSSFCLHFPLSALRTSGRSAHSCPFKALGLSPTASADELRIRYIELAKQLHPDAAAPGAAAAADASGKFIELRKTYEKALQQQQGQQRQQQQTPQRSDSVGSSAEPAAHHWQWRRGSPEASAAYPYNSALSEAISRKRHEWGEMQKERERFWKTRSQQRNERGDNTSYMRDIKALFNRRLSEEEQNEKHRRKNNSAAAESTEGEGAAAAAAAAAAREEQLLRSELRAFGLDDKYIDPATIWFPKRKKKAGKAHTWVSRPEKKFSTKAVVAVVWLFAVFGAAATVFFSVELRKESERSK
ncbi:hypothetical protein, conserved [Eimeria necatrix]|uniref:J domain-containing protein n=1 Tax=Eimeria necatrix TaxID=51315 RepID=U6ML10_9EIME|nr:hypothetical protein, conserved [Eimeria necatrix]CDJ62340.1 hypothetical protein, conserved [Eimeria necatrix]